MKQYIDAKYEANMASYIITALDHRKKALESLVTLYGQQYFAGPTAPRNLTKEWIQNQKQTSSNTQVKIKRTRQN
jgi:hypothetical protein